MLKERLYLDEKLIDLEGSESPALTFQINDLYELKDRQAIRSNKFKLVKTQQNRIALESAHIVQNETFLPYKKVSARYEFDGIEVISTGYGIIDSSGEFYEVTIYAGNANFFELIKGKYLSDLDLSSLNHVFNLTNIAAKNSSTTGINYPIVAFTDDVAYINNAGTTIDVRRFMPFVYALTLLEKIVSESGFSLAADSYFLQGKLFRSIIIQLANESFIVSGKLFHAELTANDLSSGHLMLDDSNTGDSVLRTGTFDIGSCWQTNGIGGTRKERYYPSQDVQVPNNFKLKFHIEFKLQGGNPYQQNFEFHLEYYRSGVPETLVISQSFTVLPGQTIFNSVDLEVPAGNYESGANCYFIVRFVTWSSNSTQATCTYLPGTYADAESSTGVAIQIGDPFIVKENIPKISQLDFIKAFSQIAAVTIDTDTDENKIYATTFGTVVKNKAVAIDWSEKLDESKSAAAQVDFRLGSYAQKNWMRYKKDENVADNFGDFYFEIKDETLAREADLFTLPFAATENTTALVGVEIPLIKRWDTAKGTPTVKTTPRILLVADGLPVGVSVDLFDGTNTTTIGAVFSCFIHPDVAENLGFASLIKTFYAELVLALDRVKVVQDYFKISAIDLHNFDGTVPVFVQKYNSYFYRNKIMNWRGNDSSKVQLLRI